MQQVDGAWYDNAIRFRTYAEAEQNARDKWSVWTMSQGYRADPSDDAPNYELREDGGLRALEAGNDA